MLLAQNVADNACNQFGDSWNVFMIGAPSVLQFFEGTMPADTTDPDDGTMVVECSTSDPPGVMSNPHTYTFDTISPGVAVAAGTVSYWRLKNGIGTVIMQGDVSTSGADINLNIVALAIDDTLTITSLVIAVNETYP